MSTRYLIPAKKSRIEIRVRNSRFIATAAPVFDVAAARAFIASIKEEFSDASHNVPAFIVGHGATIVAHCNDDGEPSGTAGRPVLAVLQGSGLGDIACVVTRYFGGTKLGTGGLVRAYGDAVRELLSELPLAERMPTRTVLLDVPYNLLERIRLLIQFHDGLIKNEDFAAEVVVEARFESSRVDSFLAAVSELSAGKMSAVVSETDEFAIVPVGTFPSIHN